MSIYPYKHLTNWTCKIYIHLTNEHLRDTQLTKEHLAIKQSTIEIGNMNFRRLYKTQNLKKL